MAAESGAVELERDSVGEGELAHREGRARRSRPLEPRRHLVGPGRSHGGVVERPAVSVEHRALPAAEANPHLRQAGTAGVVAAELQREQLAEPRAAVALDRHVAARLELEPVQRGLVRETAAVHRRGERQYRPLELLAHVAVFGERRADVLHRHVTDLPGSPRVNHSDSSANAATAPIARFRPCSSASP